MSWNDILNYDYSKIAHWIVAAGIVLFASIVMVVLGFVWLKIAPKKYKGLCGYKISLAKTNNDTWIYVNSTIGRFWLVCGIVLFLLDAFVMLKCMHAYNELILVTSLELILLEVALIVTCHFYVKRATKKKFSL